MPEPNLPPIRLSESQSEDSNVLNISSIASKLPELPSETRSRYTSSEIGLSLANASKLINNDEWMQYFEECLKIKAIDYNAVVNFLTNSLPVTLEALEMDFKE